jgi:hypothetical protein
MAGIKKLNTTENPEIIPPFIIFLKCKSATLEKLFWHYQNVVAFMQTSSNADNLEHSDVPKLQITSTEINATNLPLQ